MKLLAANEWNKVWFERGTKFRIRVRAELVHLDGNEKPYFSITGEVKYQAKNNRWMDLSAGACHNDILEHFPKLQPLVDIHLSDTNGVPMHSASNAAYWAGLTKYQNKDIDALARHLRVLPEYADQLADYAKDLVVNKEMRSDMAWVQTILDHKLHDNWKQDAEVALSLLNINEAVSA